MKTLVFSFVFVVAMMTNVFSQRFFDTTIVSTKINSLSQGTILNSTQTYMTSITVTGVLSNADVHAIVGHATKYQWLKTINLLDATICADPLKINTKDNEIIDALFGSTPIKNSVTKIILPKSLTRVGHRSFAELTNLETLIIPDGLLQMGGCIVQNTKVDTLIIPANCTLNYGFYDCMPFNNSRNLVYVEFKGRMPKYVTTTTKGYSYIDKYDNTYLNANLKIVVPCLTKERYMALRYFVGTTPPMVEACTIVDTTTYYYDTTITTKVNKTSTFSGLETKYVYVDSIVNDTATYNNKKVLNKITKKYTDTIRKIIYKHDDTVLTKINVESKILSTVVDSIKNVIDSNKYIMSYYVTTISRQDSIYKYFAMDDSMYTDSIFSVNDVYNITNNNTSVVHVETTYKKRKTFYDSIFSIVVDTTKNVSIRIIKKRDIHIYSNDTSTIKTYIDTTITPNITHTYNKRDSIVTTISTFGTTTTKSEVLSSIDVVDTIFYERITSFIVYNIKNVSGGKAFDIIKTCDVTERQKTGERTYTKSIVVEPITINGLLNVDASIVAYPNPTTEYIKIKNYVGNIVVLNVEGVVVFETDNYQGESIQLHSQGIYFVKVYDLYIKVLRQ